VGGGGGRGEAGDEEVVVRQDTGVGQGGAVWESALALIAWWRLQQQRHAHAEHPLGQLLPRRSGGGGGGSASSMQDSADGAAAVSTVVELGAGTGVAGIAIGALLGRSRVVLTDLPPYLPLLRHNAALNAPLLRTAPPPARECIVSCC
jgi:methylase of polypeptide subunit release factors